MKAAIFCFQKPSPTSIVASTNLAIWLGKTLNLPVLYDAGVTAEPWDVLIIVNGAFAFCKHLAELGSAVQRAGRVVWAQQDYTIVPPKPTSDAESPFRKAFADRHAEGLPGIDYWTTVARNAKATPQSRYINWNSLTYTATPSSTIQKERSKVVPRLLYYGAYRNNRESAFMRYFGDPDHTALVPTTVSSSLAGGKRFKELYPAVEVLPAFERGTFAATLRGYALGLYIEDKKSHTEFHSPANRFYEMLGAGLPMVFEPEAVPMLARAGFEVGAYTAVTAKDLKLLLRQAELVGQEQREKWGKNYRHLLTKSVVSTWKEYCK